VRDRGALLHRSQKAPRPVRRAAGRPRWLAVGVACLIAAGFAGALIGPAPIPSAQVLRKIFSIVPFVRATPALSHQQMAIPLQLRLPRVVLSGLVGAALAVSGAAYQGAFRNPLADPYLLGGRIRGRARRDDRHHPCSCGDRLESRSGRGVRWRDRGRGRRICDRTHCGRTDGHAARPGGCRRRLVPRGDPNRLQQRKAELLRDVYSWILGGVSTAGWSAVLLILPYLAVGVAVILAHRRWLDVLSVGDEEVAGLGARPQRIRLLVVGAASLATAAAVAVSGLIAFVGLIVPHIVRLVAGSSYRVILPLSILFGATFLILADLISRSVTTPDELPIGVVTAFVGGPFFLFVLRGRRHA
jgi:iron complex transport system permease protein